MKSLKESLSSFNNIDLYKLSLVEKSSFFLNRLKLLHNFHYSNSEFYKKLIDNEKIFTKDLNTLENFPFIPVRLFKLYNLLSVKDNEVIKTITSSGTTGQAVSKIYLDKNTAKLQTKVLTNIVSNFIGKARLPMLIIDSEEIIKSRLKFSARTAGILGFSIFGTKKCFALDKNMNLDYEKVSLFLDENKDQPIFIFGFTYIIYLHFYNELKSRNLKLDLSNSVLIHGGGWKKLDNLNINSSSFKSMLKSYTRINNVHDYYGMVEQTGSIHMECNENFFHVSEFSDIIIRDPFTFKPLPHGQTGLIQLFSLLPISYPGYSILTEDLGYIIGEDDCKCGRKGKYFKVVGRVPKAELRGCSDTYEK